MTLYETVERNIRGRMAQLKLRPDDIYEQCGYTSAAGLRARLRRAKGITINDLDRMAKVLRTTPERLMERSI